jgi:hypothetical protein
MLSMITIDTDLHAKQLLHPGQDGDHRVLDSGNCLRGSLGDIGRDGLVSRGSEITLSSSPVFMSTRQNWP